MAFTLPFFDQNALTNKHLSRNKLIPFFFLWVSKHAYSLYLIHFTIFFLAYKFFLLQLFFLDRKQILLIIHSPNTFCSSKQKSPIQYTELLKGLHTIKSLFFIPYFFCLTPNISHDGSRAQKGFIGQM